jgi:hypothetical protein
MPVYLKDSRVLLGSDGKVASDPACCCVLLCDSISASNSKCGFLSGLGKYYLEEIHYFTIANTVSSGGGCPPADCSGYFGSPGPFYQNASQTIVGTYDPDTCLLTWECSGSSASGGCNFDDCTSDYTTNPSGPYFWNACLASGPFGQCASSGCFAQTGNVVDSSTDTFFSEHQTYADSGNSSSDYWSLANEYTTALLISSTEGKLPAYSGNYGCDGDHSVSGQDCDCSAYSNLPDDESSYTIRRFKFKATFAADVADRTIYWTEHFVPYPPGSPIDTPMSDNVPAAATEFVHEVFEPADNGTTTVTGTSFTPP